MRQTSAYFSTYKRAVNFKEEHQTIFTSFFFNNNQQTLNMKFLAFALLITVTAAATLEKKPVAIVRSASDFKDDGSFSYSFESEDGTSVSASGSQKFVGPEPEDIGTIARGSYSYIDPEGVKITVEWTADENGFVAKGDHLPVAPIASF